MHAGSASVTSPQLFASDEPFKPSLGRRFIRWFRTAPETCQDTFGTSTFNIEFERRLLGQ